MIFIIIRCIMNNNYVYILYNVMYLRMYIIHTACKFDIMLIK